MSERNSQAEQEWYGRLIDIASNSDAQERYADLVQFHQEALDFYLPAVETLTERDAEKPSSDGRLVKLVVAHIMAWEEWQIQVFEDEKGREEHLRQQTKLRGYFDPERKKIVDFDNVDQFNAYQAKKYADWKWEDIQQKAIDTALHLQSLFPDDPPTGWIDFLESAEDHLWKLTPDKTITVQAGWYLWMVSLEHEAIEHRSDLE